jgi:hypothetical protein
MAARKRKPRGYSPIGPRKGQKRVTRDEKKPMYFKHDAEGGWGPATPQPDPEPTRLPPSTTGFPAWSAWKRVGDASEMPLGKWVLIFSCGKVGPGRRVMTPIGGVHVEALHNFGDWPTDGLKTLPFSALTHWRELPEGP